MYIKVLFFVCLSFICSNARKKDKETNEELTVVNFRINLDPNDQLEIHKDDNVRRHGGENLTVQDEEVTSVNLSNPVNNEDEETRRGGALRFKDNFPLGFTKFVRIKSGNMSDTLNFPYMAAVIINGRMWCAGALVDESWVVTAAHCLNFVLHVSPLKSLGEFVKVRVGSAYPHEGGKVIDVVGAVRHPKFEEESPPHADVALLRLAEALVLTEYINIIKIYEGIKEPYTQSFVLVSGWGAVRGSPTAFRDHTPDLVHGRLKVRSRVSCQNAFRGVHGLDITRDFFCASLRNGTRDACLFDAGAPAVQHNQLMGIMSFGPELCGDEQLPAVFIKAYYFRDFVSTTLKMYKTDKDWYEVIRNLDPQKAPRRTTEMVPGTTEEPAKSPKDDKGGKAALRQGPEQTDVAENVAPSTDATPKVLRENYDDPMLYTSPDKHHN